MDEYSTAYDECATNFTFLPVDGHLVDFQFLAVGANAVMYIPMHVFAWAYALVSLGSTPRSEVSGSHVGVCLTF